MAAEFDPRRPALLRRWVFVNAAPSVPDTTTLEALVLVVNEAVTASGATVPPDMTVRVDLRRGPDGVQCVVPVAVPLPPLSQDAPPSDAVLHNLWLAMRVSEEVGVAIEPHGAGSRITVMLLTGSWAKG
jgi:hypothetical protein